MKWLPDPSGFEEHAGQILLYGPLSQCKLCIRIPLICDLHQLNSVSKYAFHYKILKINIGGGGKYTEGPKKNRLLLKSIFVYAFPQPYF